MQKWNAHSRACVRIRFAWGRICILSCLCRRRFRGEFYGVSDAAESTGPPDNMSHRKWRESKQQLIWFPALALLGCCLVSLHFLWNILSGGPVESGERQSLFWHVGCLADKGSGMVHFCGLIAQRRVAASRALKQSHIFPPKGTIKSARNKQQCLKRVLMMMWITHTNYFCNTFWFSK